MESYVTSERCLLCPSWCASGLQWLYTESDLQDGLHKSQHNILSWSNVYTSYFPTGPNVQFQMIYPPLIPFAITRVIVLVSSYLFLTQYTSGYITVNVTKRLKNWKNCILIQIKSDLLELFYLAFYIARYRWILWELYFYFISWMTVIINKFSVLYSKM